MSYAQEDTRYDHNAPGQIQAHRPWESNEERLTGEALTAASAPAEMLRALPPWSDGPLFPDRFYPHAPALTPTTLFGLDRPDYARLDFSGVGGGYAGGTSTPTTSWW